MGILNLKITQDSERLDFYTARPELFNLLHNSNIGDSTCYDEVFQVMPNHYFNLNDCKCVRYWPIRKTEELPVEEVLERLSTILKGYIVSITNRYPVMIPVTAGKDSRAILAASRSVSEKAFYYINKENGMSARHTDIQIAGKLLCKLNLNFNVLNICTPPDQDFQKYYYQNDPFASQDFLPVIYNYHNSFSNHINLPGSFAEVGFYIFDYNEKIVDAKFLAFMTKVNYKYAIQYFDNWITGCKDFCEESGFNMLNLFYWEERMGNWGTQIQLFKDIAQEEIMPYNSRIFVETVNMAPKKFREKPDYSLMNMLIKKLWPEAMQVPVNPGLSMYLFNLGAKLGIEDSLRTLYYFMIYPIMKRIKSQV